MEISQAYGILGLAQGAGEDEVKAAYRALAQKYNPDLYDAGPLHDDAAAHMEDVNAAFDTVMTSMRMGTAQSGSKSGGSASATQGSGSAQSGYGEIRNLINSGSPDAALQQLNGISGGANDAEWNFLVGSAYYYKGWVNDAMRYFQVACRLDPGNREYQAALHNLQSSATGNMNGNPYAGRGNGAMNGAGCSCCDMCTAMMCMDMCCGNGC